jgi:hypothetical protein
MHFEFILFIYLYLFIHYLQLGRHPVTAVVTFYICTDYEDFDENRTKTIFVLQNGQHIFSIMKINL